VVSSLAVYFSHHFLLFLKNTEHLFLVEFRNFCLHQRALNNMGIHGNFIVGLSVDVLISSKNPEHKELYLLGEEIVTELGHVKITSDFYEKGAIMQNQEDDAEDDTEDDGKNDGEDDNPWFLIFADHEEGSSPDKCKSIAFSYE
jgi:hypothetical protein